MRVDQFVTIVGTIIGTLACASLTNAAQAMQAPVLRAPQEMSHEMPRVSATAGLADLLPYPLAANVVMRAPGTSRFAGVYRGQDSVAAVLEALCATSIVSGAQAFVATTDGSTRGGTAMGDSTRGGTAMDGSTMGDSTRGGATSTVRTERLSGVAESIASDASSQSSNSSSGTQLGAFVLLRTAPYGQRRLVWHEVLVFTLNSGQEIVSIELYVEDQRAWDKRFPREDGVSRVSVVTERNVAAARGRVREARFVAGNEDRVVAVIDAPMEVRHATGFRGARLMQEIISPSGMVMARTQFVSVPMVVGARD